MTDDFETPTSGIAVLAAYPAPNTGAGRGNDAKSDAEPHFVRGIALGEGDITFGASQERVYWPRETLEAAADELEGTKLVDDSAHSIPEGEEIPKQPPIESIVGEVVASKYEPGVGVVYEGEVDDGEVAALVENGRVEVSPFVFRRLGDHDEDVDARPAEEILHWRDLAVVSEGASPSAAIESEPSASDGGGDEDEGAQVTAAVAAPDSSQGKGVTALQAEALEAVFEEDAPEDADDADPVAEALASFSHLSYDGTKSGKLDESKISSDSYKSHYLFPGDTKSDSSFPVVDANGNLRRGNVESAWKLRGDAPTSKEEIEKVLLRLAKKFDNPPIEKEDADALSASAAAAVWSDDPVAGEALGSSGEGTDMTDSTDGADDGAADDPDESSTSTSNMELSDTEEDLIREARATDEPVVVASEEQARYDDAEALLNEYESYDEPDIVESADWEALEENVDLVRGILAESLSERKGVKQATAEALSLDALVGEFEDDDGEFDAEALVQSPETGETQEQSPNSDEASEPESGPDALSAEEKDEVQGLLARANTLDGLGGTSSKRSAELREQAADTVGVDDYTDINLEDF